MNAPQVAQLAYEAWRLFVKATSAQNPQEGPSPQGEAQTAWLDLDTDIRRDFVDETRARILDGNRAPDHSDARLVILHQVVAAFQLAEDQKRREQEIIDEGGEP